MGLVENMQQFIVYEGSHVSIKHFKMIDKFTFRNQFPEGAMRDCRPS